MLGPWIVSILLPDPKYADTKWMLQLLGVRAAIDIIGTPTTCMLFCIGVSRDSAITNTLRLVLMVGGLLISFQYFGVFAAVLVLVLAPLAAYPVIMIGLMRRQRQLALIEGLSFVIFLAGVGATAWLWTLIK